MGYITLLSKILIYFNFSLILINFNRNLVFRLRNRLNKVMWMKINIFSEKGKFQICFICRNILKFSIRLEINRSRNILYIISFTDDFGRYSSKSEWSYGGAIFSCVIGLKFNYLFIIRVLNLLIGVPRTRSLFFSYIRETKCFWDYDLF